MVYDMVYIPVWFYCVSITMILTIWFFGEGNIIMILSTVIRLFI